MARELGGQLLLLVSAVQAAPSYRPPIVPHVHRRWPRQLRSGPSGAENAEFVTPRRPDRKPVTSCPVLNGWFSPPPAEQGRRPKPAGLRHWRPAGSRTASLLVVVGCTNVKPGNPTVDTKEAPDYRTSVSLLAVCLRRRVQRGESSAAGLRQPRPLHNACDTLKQTGGAAVNRDQRTTSTPVAHASDTGAKEAPAINALRTSCRPGDQQPEHRAVSATDVGAAGVCGLGQGRGRLHQQADSPDVFNGEVDKFNTAKTNALNQCNSASYRPDRHCDYRLTRGMRL